MKTGKIEEGPSLHRKHYDRCVEKFGEVQRSLSNTCDKGGASKKEYTFLGYSVLKWPKQENCVI